MANGHWGWQLGSLNRYWKAIWEFNPWRRWCRFLQDHSHYHRTDRCQSGSRSDPNMGWFEWNSTRSGFLMELRRCLRFQSMFLFLQEICVTVLSWNSQDMFACNTPDDICSRKLSIHVSALKFLCISNKESSIFLNYLVLFLCFSTCLRGPYYILT